MGLVKTPVKGMNDFLPRDMEVRQHVLRVLREVYTSFGYREIETPALEHIENLTGKMGGENEKLIFQVMRRGASLARALEKGESLADSGLRYDLTLPLSRFFAQHSADLPAPFKAMQMAPVWRADQPQKGRFRQFMQCDIDILGDASNLAEIDLLCATSRALSRVFEKTNLSAFTVHLNDRRILRAMALSAGFAEDALENVFISLDKLDKIGKEGVASDLASQGFDKSAVDRYLAFFEGDRSSAVTFCRDLGTALEEGCAENLDAIRTCAAALCGKGMRFVFDPTLVRGMGYYTGPIFEITLDGYNFSVAGGGRYDTMIGRFTGQSVPACGFSIGFERILTVLAEQGEKDAIPPAGGIAFLLDPKLDSAQKQRVFQTAAARRDRGARVTVLPLKKNARFQIDRLLEDGYADVLRVYPDTDL